MGIPAIGHSPLAIRHSRILGESMSEFLVPFAYDYMVKAIWVSAWSAAPAPSCPPI